MDDLPFTSPEGQEIHLYDCAGDRVSRRQVIVDRNQPPCGVLVNLDGIQGLFNPEFGNSSAHLSDDMSDASDSHLVNIDAYPLAFLGKAGNIQANGIPYCFYSKLTEINGDVRIDNRSTTRRGSPAGSTLSYRGSEDWDAEADRHVGDADGGAGDSDDGDDRAEETSDVEFNDEDGATRSHIQVVKPICSQFYNHITHRIASRAGRLDSQQGTVTAAIAGGYANTPKDSATASRMQTYCEFSLPSDRFHDRISSKKPEVECPTACRAEFVYSIDVRGLKDRSGSCVPFRFPLFLPSPLNFASVFRLAGSYTSISYFP